MKKVLISVVVLLVCQAVLAQKKRIDSLLTKIEQTAEIKDWNPYLAQLYAIPQGMSALSEKGKGELAEALRAGDSKKQLRALFMIAYSAYARYDAPQMLTAALPAIRICRDMHNNYYLGQMLAMAGLANFIQQDKRKAIYYFRLAEQASLTVRDTDNLIAAYTNLEPAYAQLKIADSALYFGRRELAMANKFHRKYQWSALRSAMGDLGEALAVSGNIDSALFYYRKDENISKKYGATDDDAYLENNVAKAFISLGKADSAEKHVLEAYNAGFKNKLWEFTADAASILSKLYENRDNKKSIFYLRAQLVATDSVNARDKSRQFQLVADKDKQYEQDLKTEREKYSSLVRFYLTIGAAAAFLVIGIILWRNNRTQKHTNRLLSEQKEEISAQRDHVEAALTKLKTTQTQLIQSEKMASLGELTAGIAHEIQNPLNFVNNFSEVNTELVDEMDQEIDKGDLAEIRAIAMDIKENSKKINMHGKRADAIVKGMLQHSQSGSGVKEPTNINAVAEECMRLAYHNLSAKDKGFSAEMATHFDTDLPRINVLQQDIARVMLNLFNNAFYALNQKQKTAAKAYKPEVSVSTSLENGQAVIRVKDNGSGIPDSIKEKIMQPFFTTKPTGEGTGLGLSLTYDMVVKGHGGSIQVNSIEGEGSEFIIQLPAKENF